MRSDLQLRAMLINCETIYRPTEKEIEHWPRNVQVPSNASTKWLNLWKGNHNLTDPLNPLGTVNIYLFCLTCLNDSGALAGSIYSLVSLLKMRNRTVASMLVASWSVGWSLGTALSVTIFMSSAVAKRGPDHRPLAPSLPYFIYARASRATWRRLS